MRHARSILAAALVLSALGSIPGVSLAAPDRLVTIRYERPNATCAGVDPVGSACVFAPPFLVEVGGAEQRARLTVVDDLGVRVKATLFEVGGQSSAHTCNDAGAAELPVTPGVEMGIFVFLDPGRGCGDALTSLASSGTISIELFSSPE